MQLLPRYLVNNRVNIVANVAGFVTEYKPVYQRHVQVYKGIDNVIQFRLLNADQKPINVSTYIPKFVAFDENKNLVIEKDAVVQDDGSTPTKGLFTVNITENDIINIKQQFLSYNVYLVNSDNENMITYTDSHFGNDGTIRISSEAFPGAKESKQIENFLESSRESGIWYSSALYAEPGINGNEALHTLAVYTNNFIGNLTIQATLDNQVDDTTSWADLETTSFTGLEEMPIPLNYNGVFSYLRIKVDANPADKITKVLVRN